MSDLKTKLEQRAGGGEVAKRPATMQDRMDQMIPQFARILAGNSLEERQKNAERFARVALTVHKTTPGLMLCTEQTFFGALMLSAQYGLEPGPLGHVYMVPFKNRKANTSEVQFILGYKGMLELVRRSGEVVGVPKARIVYSGDKFTLHYGLEEDSFEHIPYYANPDNATKEQGEPIGAYVHVRYKQGGADVFYMPKAEIYQRKTRSAAADSGPWKTDELSMWLKTVIRANFKWMPATIEAQELVARDEVVAKFDPSAVKPTTQGESVAPIEVDFSYVDPSTGEVPMSEGEAAAAQDQSPPQ